jgi:hypothetical protein
LDVDKKRALAKALLAQQMPQGQMAGRFYVAPSPWAQAAAGIANALGQYQSGKADELQKGVDDDKKRKIAEALAAQGVDPKLTESFGVLPLENQQTVLGSMLAAKITPKPAVREAYRPGDVIFENGKEVAKIPDKPDLPPGMRIGASGQPEYIPGYIEGQEQVRRAGRPSTNINLPENKYPSKFADTLGELDAKQLNDYRKSAEGSAGMVKTLGELERLNPTALQGGTAQARLEVSNFLQGLTGVNITDPKVLADSQQYNAIVSKSILDSLGGSLGAGVSNADVQFIRNTVPQLEFSREARQGLIDYLKRRGAENIQFYQRAREYGEKNNGLKGFDSIGNAFDQVTDDAPEYTATGANGEKIVWRNGQWVPLDAAK